jgi:hypothetical protein
VAGFQPLIVTTFTPMILDGKLAAGYISDADLSSVAEEDAEFPAVTDSAASKMTRHCVKVAFIVKESYALNIVNYYVQHARQLVPNWKFGVFSTHDDAMKWTTLD